MTLSGAFLFVATPSIAKADVNARIYINPWGLFFPQPRVIKIVEPRYKVVKYKRSRGYHSYRLKRKKYNKYKRAYKKNKKRQRYAVRYY